jgi:hypothetical protein
LGDGLGLRPDEGTYYVFRDSVTGLEYLREGKELCEHGLYVELDAYECHVFLDWREVQDNEWHQYGHLAAYLNGRGVPSIEEALQEIFLQPVHGPFRDLVNAATFRQLMDARVTESNGELDLDLLADIEQKLLRLLGEIKAFATEDAGAATTAPEDAVADASVEATAPAEAIASEEAAAREICQKLEAALQLPIVAERYPLPRSRRYEAAAAMLQAPLDEDPAGWATLFSWLFTHSLGSVVEGTAPEAQSLSWMDEWLFGKLVAAALQDPLGLSATGQSPGLDEATAQRAVGVVRILIAHQRWYEAGVPSAQRAYQILVSWLRDRAVQQFLQVNRFGGKLWFNKESFEQLLGWMLTVAAVEISANPALTEDAVARKIVAAYDLLSQLQRAADASEYQIAGLLEAAQG